MSQGILQTCPPGGREFSCESAMCAKPTGQRSQLAPLNREGARAVQASCAARSAVARMPNRIPLIGLRDAGSLAAI